MIDIEKLDHSLKIKSVGRLAKPEHPFLRLIKEKVEWDNFFFPKLAATVKNLVWKG